MRLDNRKYNQIREIKFEKNFIKNSFGSVLASCGETQVICTANINNDVPSWIKNQELDIGWLTAEYSMLPGSSSQRINRERKTIINSRSSEIQRLIGRSLRTIIDLKKIQGKTIYLDCDVINADGGTRCIAISGVYVALVLAINKALKNGDLTSNPVINQVAAISIGMIENKKLLDLAYNEDSQADVDVNVIMNDKKEFIEIQGTGEKKSFSKKDLDEMLALAQEGIEKIFNIQNSVIYD